MRKWNVNLDGVDKGSCYADTEADAREELRQMTGTPLTDMGAGDSERVTLTLVEEMDRCPKCSGKLIGHDHPYCPACRRHEAAARRTRMRESAARQHMIDDDDA